MKLVMHHCAREYYQGCSNYDLGLFYAKVKFDHLGFCMGKSENYVFLESIAAIGLNVGWSIQLKELMKLN